MRMRQFLGNHKRVRYRSDWCCTTDSWLKTRKLNSLIIARSKLLRLILLSLPNFHADGLDITFASTSHFCFLSTSTTSLLFYSAPCLIDISYGSFSRDKLEWICHYALGNLLQPQKGSKNMGNCGRCSYYHRWCHGRRRCVELVRCSDCMAEELTLSSLVSC